jgi:trk system potassium uptake protein TrkA
MFVLVVGGGKVGYYRAKELIESGHEVALMEKDRSRANQIADEIGSIVIPHDGCEGKYLGEAGCNRADVVAAVTGDDEDNLVICQMAKHHFDVPRTIARVNNPKNEALFRHLGVDELISPTRMILGSIEQDIPVHELLHLAALGEGELELIEAHLQAGSPAIGRAPRDLSIPDGCSLFAVIRDGVDRRDLELDAFDPDGSSTRLDVAQDVGQALGYEGRDRAAPTYAHERVARDLVSAPIEVALAVFEQERDLVRGPREPEHLVLDGRDRCGRIVLAAQRVRGQPTVGLDRLRNSTHRQDRETGDRVRPVVACHRGRKSRCDDRAISPRPTGNARSSSSLPRPWDCFPGLTKNSVSSNNPPRSIDLAYPMSSPERGSSATHHSAACAARNRWNGSPACHHSSTVPSSGVAWRRPRSVAVSQRIA